MKKKLILGILFLLPVTILLFFFFSKHNYATLPIIKQKIGEIVNYTSVENREIAFEGKITILGFIGKDIEGKDINVLNLNQKIYKRFSGFKNFQFVMLVSKGQEAQIAELKNEISRFTKQLEYWNFVIVDDAEMLRVFENLESPLALDDKLSSDYVYIIDRERNLRGRLDDRDEDEIESERAPYKLYGYNTLEIKQLVDKLTSDLRVLFQEYRDQKNKSSERREEIYKEEKQG